MSWGKNTEHSRDRAPFTSCLGRGSLLRTITQVIAQMTPAVAGLLHLPHDLPICKGPVLAALSADEFHPRPIYLSSPHAPSLLVATSPSAFWRAACDASCRLSIKRPVSVPVFGHPREKGRSGASGDGGGAGRAEPVNTRGGGAGDAGGGQVTMARAATFGLLDSAWANVP
jgi:hypothetical protein